MKVKNSIKKVGAVAGSALMVGLTMGSAASLADFPQPFVDDDGTVASQIIVGSEGKVADVVGAVNIAAAAGQSAVQTEERTAGGSTSPGWNANNGQTLSTEKTNLHFMDDFDTSGLRTTMTSDDLSVLASGTVENVDGSDYDYDQYIQVHDKTTSLSDSDSDLDEDQLIVQIGDNEANPLYTTRTTFEQAIDVTEAGEDSAEIELFGKDFTFSDDSDLENDDTIVLFGGQETATVDEDSSTTVTIDGQSIDLYVDSVPGSGEANVEIDGSLKDSVSEGDTFSVSGIDEEVRIDSIVYRGELDYGQRGRVIFSIGSEKLTLTDGSAVQVGSDEEDIDGTEVSINDGTTDDQELSKLEIAVAAQDDGEDHLEAGDQFEDPVFEMFSFAFGGMSPSEDADSRSEIEVGTSGDSDGTLTFTDSNGESATVNVAYFDSGTNTLGMTDETDGDYDWNFVEGAAMNEDTYFIVDSGDFTHVLNVRSIDGEAADDEIGLRDVFSGTTYTATLDSSQGSDEIYIDGQQYHVRSESASEVSVAWGGASESDTGDAVTVYPTMEDDNDAMVTPVSDSAQTAPVGTSSTEEVELPTGTVEITMDDGTSGVTDVSGVDGTSVSADGDWYQIGSVWYEITDDGSQDASIQVGTEDGGTKTALSAPGVLVVEEEDDDGEENAVIVEYGDDGDDEVQVGGPSFTGDSDNGALDNDDSIYLTEYGTYAVEDDDSESVALHYPDNQATLGAGFVEDGGELSTSGGGESVTYTAVTGQGSLPNMARLDSEVTETTKSENHLILVGGPAVNTLVSDLVDSGDVDLSQLEGQSSGALLQTVDDAFANGQHALVVAGVAGSDTRAAARYVSNYDTHSSALEDAGSSMVLTEADYPSES